MIANDEAGYADEGLSQVSDERKRVEMRFAHLKIHHGFERMRLRGLSGHATSSTLPPSPVRSVANPSRRPTSNQPTRYCRSINADAH